MSESRKRYDSDFKREAVRLADSSEKNDSAIERDFIGNGHKSQVAGGILPAGYNFGRD